MVRRGPFPLLLVLFAGLAGGCTTPTTDPDSAVRALLVNHWKPDWRVTPNYEYLMTLNSGGTGHIEAGGALTWTYTSSTLTIVSDFGTDVTVNPTVTANSLVCTIAGEPETFTTLDPP